MLTNPMGFEEASKILKTRGIISENYVDLKPINTIEASPKAVWENKFAQFLKEEAKAEEKKSTKEIEDTQSHNFDYKDKSNLDNQIGQEVLNGIYFEAKENPDKTLDEIRKIVSKNLAKDGQHYMKNAAFGVKGLGYKETEVQEVSGNYKPSGYSDKLKNLVKESLVKEEITNPPAKTAEDLAKKVMAWYDWDTQYIDSGSQRNKAIEKNQFVVDWFNKHSSELRQETVKLLRDSGKLDKSDISQLERKFNSSVKESLVKEASSFDEDEIFFLWDDIVDDNRVGILHSNFFNPGGTEGHAFIFDPNSPNIDRFIEAANQMLNDRGINYKFSGDDGENLKVYTSPMNENSFEDKMAQLRAMKDQTKIGQAPSPKIDSKKQRLLSKLNMLKRSYFDLVSDMEKESDINFAASGDWYQEQLDDMENSINDIERKIQSVNEGKSQKPSIDTDLAEIDTQAGIVAMEAKLDKISEIIEAKMQRLGMIEEDTNLAELVDKSKVKSMQREIKILEKRKAKMEKIYEKTTGKAYTKEMVDETLEQDLGMNDE
jgi:hypothetical protein